MHCEAELAGGADLALFDGVVASADPSFGADALNLCVDSVLAIASS